MLTLGSADIAVKGPYPADTVLWHETGHNLDFWVAGKGISSWSDSKSYSYHHITAQMTELWVRWRTISERADISTSVDGRHMCGY